MTGTVELPERAILDTSVVIADGVAHIPGARYQRRHPGRTAFRRPGAEDLESTCRAPETLSESTTDPYTPRTYVTHLLNALEPLLHAAQSA